MKRRQPRSTLFAYTTLFRCGITQSGGSQIVHQLEGRLGVKLLDRSKRPFELTPEGKLYYDGCRDLVKKLSSLEEIGRAHV